MRNEVFLFEAKNWLKSPLLIAMLVVLFLFSLVVMLGTGGYFDGSSSSDGPESHLNSPYVLGLNSFLLVKLQFFVIAVVAGFSLYKDYRSNIYAIIYAYPFSKFQYLNGKGASVLFILTSSGLTVFGGILLGELLIGNEHPRITNFNLWSYVTIVSVYVLPTMFVVACFVFISVGITRNIFTGFIVVFCFVLYQMILENVLFDHQKLLALLDPFGQNAFHLITQNWDFDKQNSSTLPLGNWIFLNRIFWLLLSGLLYVFFTRKFELKFDAIWQYRRSTIASSPSDDSLKATPLSSQPHVKSDFSFKGRIQTIFYLIRRDHLSIVNSWMFIILSLFLGFAVFFIHLKASHTGHMTLLPLTRIILGSPLSIYTLILILSTFLFSGYLSDRARRFKINQMIDVAPVTDWQLVISKVGGLGMIQLTQLMLFFLIGIGIQWLNGYTHFEVGFYLWHLIILTFPMLLVWNVTSFFIHSLFPNLFFGLFILIILWLGTQSLDQAGITTYLLKYNDLPNLTYSDFHGYGHALSGYLSLLAYWMVFGLMLTLATMLIWIRGTIFTIRERWAKAKSRFNKPVLFALILFILTFGRLLLKMYQAEVLSIQDLPTVTSQRTMLKEYQSEWEKFQHLIQPKILNIDLNLDLFPSQKAFKAKGKYQLVNQSKTRIDTVFIRSGFDEKTEFDLGHQAILLKKDEYFKSFLYMLKSPLLPLDTMEIKFDIRNTPNQLFSKNSNVLAAGTYMRQDILPRIGYQFIDHELPLSDSLRHHHNYFHRDADYVNIRTRITTDVDQIAIAPGELISENKTVTRNTFEYTTTHPGKINYSFHSSRYRILEESYHGKQVQIFYQPEHKQNIHHMLAGVKASLDFNTKRFGAYPYHTIRILEFPHTEAKYTATLTANNIPTNELVFNINTKAMKAQVQLPFYILAHELTHEWWGNQLMPADAEGAKMLTESITEYISLCIYEKQFGREMSDKLLDMQRQRYRRGRMRESDAEPPLYEVLSHQEYLSYGKGAIAMNELSRTIGREKFDQLLGEFFRVYRMHTGNYPTTLDFIEHLKVNTGVEHHELIDYWLTQNNGID